VHNSFIGQPAPPSTGFHGPLAVRSCLSMSHFNGPGYFYQPGLIRARRPSTPRGPLMSTISGSGQGDVGCESCRPQSPTHKLQLPRARRTVRPGPGEVNPLVSTLRAPWPSSIQTLLWPWGLSLSVRPL